jgi:hypothetical protein
MATWRNALAVTIVVFLLPFPITWLLKSVGDWLGPVVLCYSLLAGSGSAFLWFFVAWQKLSRLVALFVFVPAGVIEIILLLNAFIGITVLMGAMHYELM